MKPAHYLATVLLCVSTSTMSVEQETDPNAATNCKAGGEQIRKDCDRKAPTELAVIERENPREVALIEGTQGWKYVHFPTNLPLYTYDRDSAGKSACNNKEGCSSAWPPLRARNDAKPLGDWTIVLRDDGIRQWAYKGRPVYLRYHDSPTAPSGDGADGVWHLLKL